MVEFQYHAARTTSGLLSLSEVTEVAAALRDGGLAILPTETGYMLAALATSEVAVGLAFDVKRRPRAAAMHVACASLSMAEEFALLSGTARRVLAAYTPGPVTVVGRQSGKLPDSLVTLNGTVGIRIPDHPATLQIVERVGTPITATSLNESGQPAVEIESESLRQLDWPNDLVVHVVRDDRAVMYDRPSTLVRIVEDKIEILREGPVAAVDIEMVAAGSDLPGAS